MRFSPSKLIFIGILLPHFGKSEVVAVPPKADKGVPTKSEDIDKDAVEKTKALLQDPTQRSKALGENEGAQKIDSNMKGLLGDDKSMEDFYNLASGVFGDLANKTNGDPTQMQKILEEAQKNPESFGNSLTPDQKAMISQLANKAEDKKNAKPVPVKVEK